MKKILSKPMMLMILSTSTSTLSASLLDFKYLEEANKAYQDKNYTKAEALYKKLDYNEAKFNQADTLYRQKRYQEAIDLYQSINEPELEAKKLHNIGNSYAQLKKTNEAIKAYQDALKLGSDSDTKFNLDLLKKKKEEKKEKEKKKDQKDNDKKEDQKKENKQKDKKDSKDQKKKEDKEKESKDQKDQKKKEEEKQKKATQSDQNKTQPPISNMEERKWQKMLNKRGVNTLMIPLNQGKKDNETNLW